MVTWVDFRDGYLEYLESEKEMERYDNQGSSRNALHLLTNDNNVESGQELNPFSSYAISTAWTEFVSDCILPELACHKLTFCTWTFKNLHGAPPTLTRARKRTLELIAAIDPLVRAYVIVEERGKENDRLHLHGLLLRDITRDYSVALRQAVSHVWASEGYFQLEEAKNPTGSSIYVSKYIAKGQFDGDLAFWAKRDESHYQTKMELRT